MLLFNSEAAVLEFACDHVEAIDCLGYSLLEWYRVHLIYYAALDCLASASIPL